MLIFLDFKIKRGRTVPLYSIQCISVSGHNWSWFWLLLLSSSWAVPSLAFNYFYGHGRYYSVYKRPRTRGSIRTMKRLIGWAPLVLSHWGKLNFTVIWSFVRSYRIILIQHSLSLCTVAYRHKIYIARFNSFTSHNGHSISCEFRTSTFS